MSIDIFNAFRHPKKFIKPLANSGDSAKASQKDGTVFWDIAAQEGSLSDYVELKSSAVEGIISFCKQNNGRLKLLRHINFINIDIKPNKLYSTFAYNFQPKVEMMVDGVEIKNEKPVSASISSNTVIITSNFMNGATVTRSFYPSLRHPALIEKIEVINNTKSKVTFTASEIKNRLTDKTLSIKKISFGLPNSKLEVGSRIVDANGDFRNQNMTVSKKLLVPGATATCYLVHYAINRGEVLNFNAEKEIKDYIKFKTTPNS